MRVLSGRPYPLGAAWDGSGVNFAIFSQHATKVELCLFDPKGRREFLKLMGASLALAFDFEPEAFPDWAKRIVVFDTETTGLDLREARIVTACVV